MAFLAIAAHLGVRSNRSGGGTLRPDWLAAIGNLRWGRSINYSLGR